MFRKFVMYFFGIIYLFSLVFIFDGLVLIINPKIPISNLIALSIISFIVSAIYSYNSIIIK